MPDKNKQKGYGILAVTVIVCVAANLRAPITAVGPVLHNVMDGLQLGSFEGSLLTAVPLAVFAAGSVLIGRAAAKTELRLCLIWSVIILTLGLYIRVMGTVPTLYLGSVLMGIGICIGNVMMPAYIKEMFAAKIGLVTGVFSVAMNLMAAFSSGLSIFIGERTGAGWRGSMGIWMFWGLLTLVVLVIERILTKKLKASPDTVKGNTDFQKQKPAGKKINVFHSPQAWNISFFMGMQSLVYYCLISLLPSILIDKGIPQNETGWVISVIQLAMLPVMFIGPTLAFRMKNQKKMVYLIGITMFVGIVLLTVSGTWFIYPAAVLIGMGNGLSFSLSILFFSLRTRTLEGTIGISGMAQSVGYSIAACGPPVFGFLHRADASWNYSFYFLMFTVLVMTFFGNKAASAKFIEDDKRT